MSDLRLLKNFALENKIKLSDSQLEQFRLYQSFLIEKNKVINLTAIDNPEDIEIKHFIDSIVGAKTISGLAGEAFKFADVGCGAGLPGIPLKIIFPETNAVLLDSINKKIQFVNEAIKCIGLTDIEGIAARAEDFGQGRQRESFDICVSRAVAEAAVLLEYCLPLVRVGGHCVLYKSGKCEEEIGAASRSMEILGGKLEKIEKFSLPNNKGERSLVIISKEKAAPIRYPRRPGKPSKSPIKT